MHVVRIHATFGSPCLNLSILHFTQQLFSNMNPNWPLIHCKCEWPSYRKWLHFLKASKIEVAPFLSFENGRDTNATCLSFWLRVAAMANQNIHHIQQWKGYPVSCSQSNNCWVILTADFQTLPIASPGWKTEV